MLIWHTAIQEHKNYVAMVEPIGPIAVSFCEDTAENQTFVIVRTKSGTEELSIPHYVEETTKSGERVRKKTKHSLKDILATYTQVWSCWISGLVQQWQLTHDFSFCLSKIPHKALIKVKDEHAAKITKELCSFHKSQVWISIIEQQQRQQSILLEQAMLNWLIVCIAWMQIITNYKFGVLYAIEGQVTEDSMFCNRMSLAAAAAAAQCVVIASLTLAVLVIIARPSIR
jgi:hypothetical protein